jgi:hypothetical protein
MAPAYNTIHIILDQLNEAFVERAFRRIASSIIWTVSAILSRVAPKRRRRCVSAGGTQETVRVGDPAPVTDPRNDEELASAYSRLPRSPANADQKNHVKAVNSHCTSFRSIQGDRDEACGTSATPLVQACPGDGQAHVRRHRPAGSNMDRQCQNRPL